MLRLILGRAGSGKTTAVRNILADYALQGARDMILIVPEQFSFESEREMLRMLGAKESSRVEILSFTRLVNSVFREYGGKTGASIDDSGRAVLMSLALEEVRDKLNVYSRLSTNASLAAKLVGLRGELSQCDITPDDMDAVCDRMNDGMLKNKTSELSLIFRAYDVLLERGFLDDTHALTRLNETLLEHPFFKGRIVAIDAFKSFTVQERKIISRIMEQAEDVYVTLCADKLNDDEDGSGVFSLVKRCARQLIGDANKLGVKVAAPVILNEQTRFEEDSLRALERGLFQPGADVYEGKADNVTIFRAQNKEDECHFVGRTVRRLLREENLRCRDIAIIARDIDWYSGEMESTLSMYGIPVFKDKRQPLDSQPLMAFVRGALEIASFGFRTESVLRLCKTGMTSVTPDEIYNLENYVLQWRIDGKKWLKDWTENPKGLGFKMGDEEKETLSELNGIRAKIVTPLEKFSTSCKEADGLKIARAVYELLETERVSVQLLNLAKQLREAGERDLALEQERVWDVLMALLGQIGTILNGRSMSPRRFAELFEVMLSAQQLGTIPQGLDELPVGSAERMRVSSPKAVFVVGANEGIFPQTPAPDGIFTDSERRRLIELGLEMGDDCEHKAVGERFIAYNTLCSAREKLYVSYIQSDDSGEGMSPSEIVKQINKILPNCRAVDTSEVSLLERIESERPAFEQLALIWQNNSGRNAEKEAVRASLKEYFENNEKYNLPLKSLKRASDKTPYHFADSDVSKELFGKNMRLSASQIEVYHKCAFQYFCKYGLLAKPRKTAEMDALNSGTLLHYVLEQMIRRHGGKGLSLQSESEMADEIHQILQEYLDEYMGGKSDKSCRFTYQLRNLARVLEHVLLRIAKEFAEICYEPVDFELKMGDDPDCDIPPYTIELPDGGMIKIRGSIDRVDRMESDGKSYIRIVDYKSGSNTKEFALSDVLEGLNMQMLVYLMDVWENGGKRYGDIIPAGVLYMPVKLPSASLKRDATEAEAEKERIKSSKMNGMLLDHSLSLAGMAMGEAASNPYILSRKTVNLSELKRLKKKIDETLLKMAEELHSGCVPAMPVQGKRYDGVCDRCDYDSVCCHEKHDKVKNLSDFDHDEVLKILNEEENDNGEA